MAAPTGAPKPPSFEMVDARQYPTVAWAEFFQALADSQANAIARIALIETGVDGNGIPVPTSIVARLDAIEARLLAAGIP